MGVKWNVNLHEIYMFAKQPLLCER